MIEAQAVARARAAVVAGEKKTLMAEILHDLDRILRHRAETVIDVVGAGFGQRTVAVTA